ncbi:acyltransferase family protein, partial [Streptomyces sp. PU-14G]|uniref:acyltransferase family protein n=1 Tax=Streptomyces sp. PU-14G TaxID=2800808 RepID=UPI0034DE2B7C
RTPAPPTGATRAATGGVRLRRPGRAAEPQRPEQGSEPQRPEQGSARRRPEQGSARRRPGGASAARRYGGRDPFLDNAKFLLVVLVVLAHNWAPVADGMRGVKAAWLLVYAFHLPALILLSGYLSRGFTGRPEQVRRLLTHVLVPYLAFEVAYAGMDTLLWDRPFAVTPTRPSFVCWFLAALFVWRLTAPLWHAVRWPVALAALVSVGTGFLHVGGEPALPRLLMYWPWFVLGLRLRPEHLRALWSRAARLCALPVVAAAVVGAWWAAPRVSRDWLLMEATSDELGLSPLMYVGVRSALFGVGAVLVAAFLALVSSRPTRFSALGACALYPFLLHGLVFEAVERAGGYRLVLAWGLPAVAGATVLALGLAVLLGTPQVRSCLWPFVEPPFPAWLRGRPGGSPAESRAGTTASTPASRPAATASGAIPHGFAAASPYGPTTASPYGPAAAFPHGSEEAGSRVRPGGSSAARNGR